MFIVVRCLEEIGAMKLDNENVTGVVTQESESEKGASLVEYGLLVALIVGICIAALTFMGKSVSQQFSKVGRALS